MKDEMTLTRMQATDRSTDVAKTEETEVCGNRNYRKRRYANPLQNYRSHPPPHTVVASGSPAFIEQRMGG